ncbi:MAG TPA: zinc-ribbon and DUF3426 domain-containing protein [Gammaproteobacteria bacterium]
MFTRCPTCHTLFRIQPQHLKAARGKVRCGSCRVVFDALEFLVNQDELSAAELSALAKAEADGRQQQLPFDDLATPLPQHESSPLQPEAVAPERPAAAVEPETASRPMVKKPVIEETPTENSVSQPEEVSAVTQPRRYALHVSDTERMPPRRAARLGWAAGSLLLLLLLVGQLAFLQRDSLARDLRWRPWLEQICGYAGCTLPPLRDPRAIEMVDRNVQSHPDYLNALAITATIVNQAPFAQPYPEVELAMTDLDQKRLAARRFRPAEYLEHDPGTRLIPPGASVHIKLEIADPGQEAVGFEFAFY